MDYANLIAEFGANYGMGDLAPDENGAVGFEVDGRSVVIQQLPEMDDAIATVELGEAEEAGAAAVNRLLLQANQALFVLDGMALVLHSESNRYRLISRLPIETLDFAGFDEKISQLLDRAEQWSAFLDKFQPLAAETEEKGTESAKPTDVGVPPFEMLRI